MKKIISALTIVSICFLFGCESKEKNKEQEKITDYPKQISIELANSEIKLNKIEKGSFEMGSSEGVGEEDELPVRQIEITKDYYIGITEITQKQWEDVMGENPSTFKGENLPVESVTYAQCLEFCKKLSEKSGYSVTLPTEAQWEYACRADTKTRWFFGDDESSILEYTNMDPDAKTYEAGTYKPNQNGLYDMYGNVMEWCLDYYYPYYMENDTKDPLGPESGEARVSRGGGYGGSIDACRSGYRNACGENDASDGIGLRIVITIP